MIDKNRSAAGHPVQSLYYSVKVGQPNLYETLTRRYPRHFISVLLCVLYAHRIKQIIYSLMIKT